MTLSPIDYFALSPLIIVATFALIVLFIEAFCSTSKRMWAATLCCVGLASATLATLYAPASIHPYLTNFLYFDALSRFFSILFLSIGILVSLLATNLFKQTETTQGEFYFFLLSSIFGLMLISAAKHFLTLFLGLETLSIALYVLTGYVKANTLSHEASFKYFILGSVSTAIFLFGIAMVFVATGATDFDTLAKVYKTLTGFDSILFVCGMLLVSVTLLFKAAIVPFHIWAPDVYAGAPTSVTAFMAVGTKAGAFAALIRLFLLCFSKFDPLWQELISFIAYPTLIWANFVAMQTTQMRRFFAWSGISHAGFLLIALAAQNAASGPSMLFYLVVYSFATLGAFASFCFLEDKGLGVDLHDLRGIFYSHPMIALCFTLCLLTLGGIPPTIGFFAKFYVLQAAFAANLYGLVVVGLLTTILSAYYYLRIVAVMFSEKVAEPKAIVRSHGVSTTACISFGAICFLSFYPEPFLRLMNVAW